MNQNKYSVFDAHCDTLSLMLETAGKVSENTFQTDARRMALYKSYTQVFACFTPSYMRGRSLERCLEMIDLFYAGGMKGILSIEGGECITSPAVLRIFSRLGVRVLGLTWNNSNHLAAGADETDTRKGLTGFGRKIVREARRLKMTIDVSHLNDRSFYDCLEETPDPVVATHSNSRAVCAHRRNLTDDMFVRIAKSGGCAGINFYPPFLNDGAKAGISDIIRHIEHFMALGGEDHIGIGADFDGMGNICCEEIRGCGDTYKIFDELLRLNYTQEQVEKISHKNFERIFDNA